MRIKTKTFITLFIFTLLFSVIYIHHDHAKAISSKKYLATKSFVANTPSDSKNFNYPNLISSIDNSINSYSDELSASATFIDLDNNQVYNAGAVKTLFKAASCEKVLTAVDFLHQVEFGQASLSQDIDGSNAHALCNK